MRIFIAGASGLIGVRLVPLLVAAGHQVAGLTRSPEKSELLSKLGAQPVVCYVYDAGALTAAVAGFAPDDVVHQLTDLIRYGQFWGPGTYCEAAPPNPPRIHVDEAALRTVPALDSHAGAASSSAWHRQQRPPASQAGGRCQRARSRYTSPND